MVARGVGGDRVSPRYQREEQDAGGHKGPPIRTNLRTDEFDPAVGDRRSQSPRRRQQAKQRLLITYEKPGVARVVQLAHAVPSAPIPGLGSHA